MFNNACLYGIWVAQGKGAFTAKNNIFVANRMSAIEVRGRLADPHAAKVNLIDNTVLFTWSRTKDMGDMALNYKNKQPYL